MWNRLLIAKNLSSSCSASYIQSYLETEADLMIVENGVQFMWGIKHSALITLTEEVTERRLKDIVQHVLYQKPLNGKRLVLLPVKFPPTSILIHDLDPGMSEEYLSLHFENRRSGSFVGGLLDDGVEMYPELKLAVVNFVSNEVVQGVLAVKDHILKGNRLHIEPCYTEFHLPLINELQNSSARGVSRDPDAQATPSPVLNPSVYAASSTISSTGGSVNKGVKTKKPDSSARKSTPPPIPPKPKTVLCQHSHSKQHAAQLPAKDDDDELYDCVPGLLIQQKQESVAECIRRFNPLPAESRQARKSEEDHRRKSVPQFENTDYAEHLSNATFTRNPSSAPRLSETRLNAFREIAYLRPKHDVPDKKHDAAEDCTESCDYVSSLPYFSLGDHETLDVMPSLNDVLGLDFTKSSSDGLIYVDHHGLDEKVLTNSASLGKASSYDPIEEELMEKLENLTLENERLKQLATPKQVVPVEVPAYKLALLQDFAKTDHGCHVTIRQSEGLVLLHGTQEACDSVKCQLLMLVQGLSECICSVPAPIIKLVRSQKGSRYLASIHQNHASCSFDVRDTHIVFAAREMQDAKAFTEDFKKRTVQKSVQVHFQTLHNASFLPLKMQLQDEYLVCLTLPTDDSMEVVEVMIDGFDGDVDLAVREIDKQNDTYKPGEEVFNIPGMLPRKACDTWFSKELEEVKALILKNDGDVTRLDTDGLTLAFQCRPEVLKVAREKLSAIKESIITSSLNLKSKFKLYSEGALVINGLHSSGVEQFCSQWERKLSRDEGFPILISMTLPSKCPLPEIRISPGKNTMHSDHPWSSGHSRHHGSKSHSDHRGHHHGDTRHRGHGRYMQPQCVMLGNATFTVKSGNITREKVDVLVNVVGEDLKMNSAVGSAIYKRYPQVGKLLLAQKGNVVDQCQVFLTQIPPDQQAESHPSIVLHVVLKKCANIAVAKNVKQMVQKCLQLAVSSGAKSISFPPLGCGRMFRYPDDVVADTMIFSIVEFLQANPASMQKVTIIVYDAGLARFFRETMQQKLTLVSDTDEILMTSTDETLKEDDDQETDDEDEEFVIVSADSSEDTSLSGKFEALICTRQPADCHDIIKVKLMQILQETFLYTDSSIRDCTNFRKLNSAAIDEIKRAAAKNNVVLTMHVKESGLHVCGEKACVKEVVALISSKLLEYMAMQESAADDHRKRLGLPVDTDKIPSYWKSFKKTPSRRGDAYLHSHKKQLNSGSELKDVTGAERKAVEQLVMVTWQSNLVGAGADARSLGHMGIKVLEVKRLENLFLWEQYSIQRERLFRRLGQSGSKSFEELATKLPRGLLQTTQNLTGKSPLAQEVYLQVNEHYLFHGTKMEVVRGICRDGLDFRLASERLMLGRGIYLAESSTKSDQYADPKTGRSSTGEKLTMILVRTLLGEPFVSQEQNPHKFQRPPCKACLQVSCGCSAEQFDSVIDDTSRLFREFVLYDKNHCYPEYFITYQRV